MTEPISPSSRSQRLLSLIILLGFIASLILVAWLGLGKIEQQSRLQTKHALQSVLRSTNEALYVWLDNRLKNLKGVGQSPELVKLTQAQLALPREPNALKNSKELVAIRNLFEPTLKEHNDLGIFIIAPDLISIASMRNSNIGTLNIIAQQKNRLMKQVLDGETLFIPPINSDVLLKDRTGRLVANQPTMFIATPIKDNKGEIIAALTLRLDPSKEFSKINQLGRIGETGETYALDKAGILISESRFDEQLRSVGQLAPNERTILSIRISDPGIDLTQGLSPQRVPEQQPLTLMAQQATAGIAGFNIDGYRDYRGVEVFGAWLWDDKLGFAMATEIDANEALQPFYATRVVMLTSFVITTLLVAILLILLAVVSRNSKRNLILLYRQLEQRVRERTVALEDAKVKLSIANRELQELARVDSLTGLANRRHLEEFLSNEWQRCQREQQPLSYVLFDIDHFKRYNDHYGHLAGDECLQEIGRLLLSERFLSRPGDLIARYGGEEFALVLSGTALEDAEFIMKKVMKALNKAALPHQGNLVAGSKQITISAGVACLVPNQSAKVTQLLELADHALYKAKAKGRNQYQTASQTNLAEGSE